MAALASPQVHPVLTLRRRKNAIHVELLHLLAPADRQGESAPGVEEIGSSGYPDRRRIPDATNPLVQPLIPDTEDFLAWLLGPDEVPVWRCLQLDMADRL